MSLGSILGAKAPAPVAPVTPVAEDPNATAAAEEAARLEREKSRRGFASTILTGPTGMASTGTSASKTLLGQ